MTFVRLSLILFIITFASMAVLWMILPVVLGYLKFRNIDLFFSFPLFVELITLCRNFLLKQSVNVLCVYTQVVVFLFEENKFGF
ncbi:hypothetical protein CM19_01205 [Candidatus Acidianus copahuensis]|uniref:Uncharacterized protein n=1 Tax=Candidatus Acidianus copahuensis TaxID=1160895 RepID=A0A031LUC6_9CREN|nr:hypothetical protein CM19_01205 [Candidatus Acidianus copahuensis]